MKSVPMQEIYRGAFAPVLAGMVLLGLASISILLLSDPPYVDRVDPRTMLLIEVALLALAGVIIPAVLLMSKRIRREPRTAVGVACVAALMVHAFVLGEPVRRGAQGVTSAVASVLAAAFFFVSLLAVMERLDAQRQDKRGPGGAANPTFDL
ncbi:hypothetical protein ACIQXM_15210 [Arthrobacter sp. NPDC097144]|uniref:hypothetical protein n=1 Tax=Arthrobacter sp. NPDC097144 TaxID=3363946 RepID=UPI0038246251